MIDIDIDVLASRLLTKPHVRVWPSVSASDCSLPINKKKIIANNNYYGRKDNGKHNILIIQYHSSD